MTYCMEWPDFDRQIAHLAPASRAKVQEAFELGKKVHDGQKRKSGEPYFTHPIEVALMLARMGADEDTLITALLHDTVEDTPVTIEDIGAQFGPSVQQLIDGLTKLTAQEFAEKPTLNEQVETLRKMFTLMRQDVRIMVIKLTDRLHNMQTIRFLPANRQLEMAMETADIYVRVASKLGMQDMRDDLEGLCLSVTEPSTSIAFVYSSTALSYCSALCSESPRTMNTNGSPKSRCSASSRSTIAAR